MEAATADDPQVENNTPRSRNGARGREKETKAIVESIEINIGNFDINAGVGPGTDGKQQQRPTAAKPRQGARRNKDRKRNATRVTW